MGPPHRSSVRPGDVVARLGGDEFTVLCEGVEGEAAALEIAGRLHRALREPFTVAGQRRQVRASIGCRLSEGHGAADADELLRDADVAMYQAKGAGKDRVELFSRATRALIVRRLQLEQDLRDALAEGRLEVHFQPQVELATGRVVGAEALARWTHPGEGPVAPLEFVGVAEETGLIVPLGSFELDEACRRHAAWRAAGLAIPPAELHTLAFDLPGVPAAASFLWVVHRLYRGSLNDWNRRPLVGRAGRHSRPAPWTPAPADS